MKKCVPICSLVFILFVSCAAKKEKSVFRFIDSEQGIELMENGQPVLFYQKAPKSPDGKYFYNNYIHPLYGLNGDILTEEFPNDHPYHRGIFCGWHQVFVEGESVGNSWIMEHIEQKIVDTKTSFTKQSATLKTDIIWISPLYQNGMPFMSEQSTITTYSLEENMRCIDFEISLKALVNEVEIGGADNEKGYGGFCLRIKLPDNIVFTSQKGVVIPDVNQIDAGSWMDFSASFGGNDEVSGLTLLCHPQTPNYPANWILRSEKSMQNIVFPGKERVRLPKDVPIVLFYQIVIHDEGVRSIDIKKVQSEYESKVMNDE